MYLALRPRGCMQRFDRRSCTTCQVSKSEIFHTEVLDADVAVPGLNRYGKVTCGKLTLLGPAAPFPSQVYDNDSEIGVWKWT
jgi:hypothetical protein